MRHDDESPYAKSGGNDHHSGGIASRLLFRDADNVGSNEPAELAYRIEDAEAGRDGIAAEKCSGDVRTMGREQFMPLSREQRGGWKTDRDSREGSRQTAGEMRGEAAVRLQNRTPRRFA